MTKLTGGVELRVAAGRFVERNHLGADNVSDLLALKTLDLKDGEPVRAGHGAAPGHHSQATRL